MDSDLLDQTTPGSPKPHNSQLIYLVGYPYLPDGLIDYAVSHTPSSAHDSLNHGKWVGPTQDMNLKYLGDLSCVLWFAGKQGSNYQHTP